VLEADNGPAALQLWETHEREIQLLVADIVMPGDLSGRELAVRCQAQAPSLCAVLTSGYASEALEHDLTAHKRFAFLPKPYSPADLLLTVRKCLDAK
jgi:CheY-like chemotaxis protein